MLTLAKIIRGTLVPIGRSPDGDSIRFRADNSAHFAELRRGHRIEPGPDGTVQLRLQGVDAPETHYLGHAQPMGDVARDALFRYVGIHGLQVEGEKIVACEPQTVPAVILTTGGDVHGRPISYLLPAGGAGELVDGKELRIKAEHLHRSVNYKLVAHGQAYPLFYESMAPPHIAVMGAAALAAAERQLGIWAHDRSADFRLHDATSIGPGGQLVFPKLFRRCTDYLRENGGGTAGLTLKQWLERTPAENDGVILGKAVVPLAGLVKVRNGHVGLAPKVWEMVFEER